MTPVAEQGASSRMRSNWPSGHHRSGVLASPWITRAVRPMRSRFSCTRVRRCSSASTATTPARAGCNSSRWAVLPPGAAQASSTQSPGWGSSRRAACWAAPSCTEQSPVSKPGSLATSQGRSSRMQSSPSSPATALMSTSAMRASICSRLWRWLLLRIHMGGRWLLASMMNSQSSG
ncbi:hypothetical protein D3C84_878720 [compost metagenome]